MSSMSTSMSTSTSTSTSTSSSQNEYSSEESSQDTELARSQVAQFYDGRCVLVTGASGFIGKLLVEKLLRTCRGIKKIYVLIRAKRLKTPNERLKELFKTPIFDKIKDGEGPESFNELKKKVNLLEGELTQPLLGLSNERILQLTRDKCSVIIHSAAIVSFKEDFKRTLKTNLGGTNNILQLATRLPQLCALVFVSTCYSNCTQRNLGEHIYPVNVDPRELLGIAEFMDEQALEIMGTKLAVKHPNYYAYTKQLAEFLCAQNVAGAEQLPIVICRPSIVVSTFEEPLKAFVDNRNGANGIFDGVSRGIMRVAQGRGSTCMDLIPADLVVNCALALAWFCDAYHRVRVKVESAAPERGESFSLRDKLEAKMLEFYEQRMRKLRLMAIELGADAELMQVPVFNVSSGLDNSISYKEMINNVARHTLEFPGLELMRQPSFSMSNFAIVCKLRILLQQTLVGKLLDLTWAPPSKQQFQGSPGRRPSSWSQEFERINKFNSVLTFYYTTDFKFYSNNRHELIERFMNEEDRQEFNCDVRQVNWDSFARDITLGIRRYLIGEPDGTLPEARAKLSRTLMRNWLIQLALYTLFFYFIMTFFINYF